MAGDTRHSEQVELTIRYSHELSEDITPEPGRAGIVISPAEYIKVKKWSINRVFYFLAFTSAMCLATVILAPNPIVQETALGVWAGSVGLAKLLLATTYKKGT